MSNPQRTPASETAAPRPHDPPPLPAPVVATRRGRDSRDSFPVGNGSLAANLWIEENGDFCAYLARDDAWDENARLIKLGGLRLRLLAPDFLAAVTATETTLDLATARWTVRLSAPGREVLVTAYVEAAQPVLRWTITADFPLGVRVERLAWRERDRELSGRETHCLDPWASPLIARADLVLAEPDGLAWVQHNPRSLWAPMLRAQGLGACAARAEDDPLLHRVFGVYLRPGGWMADGPDALRSACDASRHQIACFGLTLERSSPAAWLEHARSEAARHTTDGLAGHLAWWRAFWARSYVVVEGGGESTARLTAAYAHQRYLTACCSRGRFPVKFNGALFTAAWGLPDEPFGPDYRRWGGCYWFQNTRLLYWPLLASGDFEMLEPLFALYRDALPVARERVRAWFGHAGACFPETMYFFGAHRGEDYGMDRAGRAVSEVANPYIAHYWCGVLELLALGLDRQRRAPDATFLADTLLPLTRDILRFYSEHYPRTPDGRLRFEPSQSLEQFHATVDPLPEIAGLEHVIGELLALDGPGAPGEEERLSWSELRAALPPVPTAPWHGGTRYLPAARKLDPTPRNGENPELYAVFPFRLAHLGANLAVGHATYLGRVFRDSGGWRQDAVQAACLGLAEAAACYVQRNVWHTSPPGLFHGFHGPNFDWMPDMDHGAVVMLALQEMLVQNVAGTVTPLPAWPEGWSARFRLHAHGGRIVAGRVADGVFTPDA